MSYKELSKKAKQSSSPIAIVCSTGG